MRSVSPWNSVVFRLRAGFGGIALLTAASLLIGLFAIQKIANSNLELVENAVPSFVQAQKFDREILSFLQLAEQARNADKIAEIAEIGDKVDASHEALSRYVENVSFSAAEPEMKERLKLGLDALHREAHALGALSVEKLEREQQLAAIVARASLLHDEFSLALEEMRLATDTELSRALRGDAPDFGRVRALMQQSEAVRHLETSSIVIRDLTAATPLAPNTLVVSELAEKVRFEITGSTKSLLGIGDVGKRSTIAALLKKIFAFNLGEDNIADLQLSYLRLTEQIEDKAQQQFRLMAQISDARGMLDRSAGALITARSQDAQSAVASSQRVLAIAGAAIMVLTVVIIYFVVERQINFRMPRLANAVRNIADGKRADRQHISGPDEIGAIVRALDVFEANAIELRRSNEELERFAYAAAHDLRSPLGAIHSLTTWTLEDFGDRLPEEGKENLLAVTSRVMRLSKLLDDLLSYSKINKENSDAAAVNLRDLVSDVCITSQASSKFKIHMDVEDAEIRIKCTPVRQVLMNLISNAIKHHDNACGEVLVQANIVNGNLLMSVTDDGPGIEPQYHDRIFELFSTLKSRDEVEGSGLGLSIVKKRIEYAGGSISVTSDPSKSRGTRFEILWPLKSRDEHLQMAA